MKTPQIYRPVLATVVGWLALSYPAYSELANTPAKTSTAVSLENAADPFGDLTREIRNAEERAETTAGEKRADAAYKLNGLKWREADLRRRFDGAKYDELVEDARNSVR